MRASMTVELFCERIDGAPEARIVLFFHGILGSGQNLRTIARRMIETRSDLSAWLVDLRGHGRSPKGTAAPSIDACAEDVVRLARDASPIAAVGHSFGGKVALALSEKLALDDVVTIDTAPGARAPLTDGDAALAVLASIESLPPLLPTKTAFIRALAEKHGRSIAQWLALSTEETDGGIRFALDHCEIRALLADYFARDLWPLVEAPRARVHLVIGERSISYSPEERTHAAAVAAREPRVTVDVLPADHWVHVDAPDGLLRVLTTRIGGAR
jgi:pimeloyl-ACP methyl ester carboxylesterase